MLEAIRHAALALQYAEFAKAHQHRLADKDSLPPLVQQQLEHGTQVRPVLQPAAAASALVTAAGVPVCRRAAHACQCPGTGVV